MKKLDNYDREDVHRRILALLDDYKAAVATATRAGINAGLCGTPRDHEAARKAEAAANLTEDVTMRALRQLVEEYRS